MTDKGEKTKKTISRDEFNKAMEEARNLVRVGVTTGMVLPTPSKSKAVSAAEKSKDTKKGKAEKL